MDGEKVEGVLSGLTRDADGGVPFKDGLPIPPADDKLVVLGNDGVYMMVGENADPINTALAEVAEEPLGEPESIAHIQPPNSFMGYPVKPVDSLTDDPNPIGRMATPEEAEEMARAVVGNPPFRSATTEYNPKPTQAEVAAKLERIMNSTMFPPPRTPEFIEFNEIKVVVFKGGPIAGCNWQGRLTDENGLLYFFRDNGAGRVEQAIYRITLVQNADNPQQWDWIGEYVGKRYCPTPMVNGIRKGS